MIYFTWCKQCGFSFVSVSAEDVDELADQHKDRNLTHDVWTDTDLFEDEDN